MSTIEGGNLGTGKGLKECRFVGNRDARYGGVEGTTDQGSKNEDKLIAGTASALEGIGALASGDQLVSNGALTQAGADALVVYDSYVSSGGIKPSSIVDSFRCLEAEVNTAKAQVEAEQVKLAERSRLAEAKAWSGENWSPEQLDLFDRAEAALRQSENALLGNSDILVRNGAITEKGLEVLVMCAENEYLIQNPAVDKLKTLFANEIKEYIAKRDADSTDSEEPVAEPKK